MPEGGFEVSWARNLASKTAMREMSTGYMKMDDGNIVERLNRSVVPHVLFKLML